MILVIDNFDSFVYNLARYVENSGHDVLVVRNNAIMIEEIAKLKPSHIILSPGPCTPDDAGITLKVIEKFYKHVPILGVCLGHQAIGKAFGAKVTFAKHPMHGKASIITHKNSQLFKQVPDSIMVGRYHSLIVNEVTADLDIMVTACSLDNEIMAIEHKKYPIFGVQFHPESILTEYGMQIIQNFVSFR